MTKERKDAIATWSALGMIIFGVILTAAGFCVAPVGQIDDSVLWVLGQCLLYAGGIFGVTLYTKHRLDEIDRSTKHSIKYMMRHPELLNELDTDNTDEDGTVA